MRGSTGKILMRTMKYGAIVGGTAIGGTSAYIYFTTPSPIPASAYRKTVPQFERRKSLEKLRRDEYCAH
ncbi:hypothetical protein Pmar_PMAR024944 [Perkinsus marinus ATCC 50983]|uniref:Uncharacterized protein n=1 Tax=Perkinsus marinus (strain ATCC 50983 / TXsc) TaxID=423536 RepID=C5K4I5_PERM5|nr:hypothetical protein Pmar_PMAR024944 [Perkinsus marinus ATCC 50983]EER20610.1 hypothetical protein Pmar_PMAR024944 [Perkinsus marinus ATCC 50983]|eukprot:XP_002788814.1 hypothetical protein Pmar_PMAR024944 [Perkinsus marinus ATCC 50983]